MVRHRHSATERKSSDKPDDGTRPARILALLRREFPSAWTELKHSNPFQLLIATILSAQCTDERVNALTPGLFAKYHGPRDFAHARPETLEQEIRSTGFFRMKTRNIIACSKALINDHDGMVPQRMEELVKLPGVGRKTANVVLGQAFGITAGIVVDTHVHRLSQRLGFSSAESAERVEEDLMVLFNQKDWIDLGSVLILHGRRTCGARVPKCESCVVSGFCPSAFHVRGGKRVVS